MSKKKRKSTCLGKLGEWVYRQYKKVNFWNFSFFVIIVLITALAVVNSLYPDVYLLFSVAGKNFTVPGDYFYELIFNPLWVIAAFLYERNVHYRLSESEQRLAKIDALAMDALIKEQEAISVKTVTNILGDKSPTYLTVEDIADEKEFADDIDDFDTIGNDQKKGQLNLKL